MPASPGSPPTGPQAIGEATDLELAAEPVQSTQVGPIEGALEAVAVVGFVAMILITLLQVAVRYLEISLDWTEELARILFLAAIMIGIALAIRRRQHIAIDVVYAKVSKSAQVTLSIAFDVLTLFLLAVWMRGALLLTKLNAGTTFVTVPWLPVSALYAIEAVGIGLMMIFVVADLIRRRRAPSQAGSQ